MSKLALAIVVSVLLAWCSSTVSRRTSVRPGPSRAGTAGRASAAGAGRKIRQRLARTGADQVLRWVQPRLLWRDFFYRELRGSPAMSASICVSACMGVMCRMTDSALLRKLQ